MWKYCMIRNSNVRGKSFSEYLLDIGYFPVLLEIGALEGFWVIPLCREASLLLHLKDILFVGCYRPGGLLGCNIILFGTSILLLGRNSLQSTSLWLLKRISRLCSHCHKPCYWNLFNPFYCRVPGPLICPNFVPAVTWLPLRIVHYRRLLFWELFAVWTRNLLPVTARLGIVFKLWSSGHTKIVHVVLPTTWW